MVNAQLATPLPLGDVGRFIADDNWVAEQKLDGHRILLYLTPDRPATALTRNGSIYTKGLPRALTDLRVQHRTLFDGELVGNQYWAFDYPEPNTAMLRERRALLEVAAAEVGISVVPQARTTTEKEALLYGAAEAGLEGIVLKRADSLYLGQRTDAWRKVKFVSTVDVVVLAVRDDGKESASLGITDGKSFTEVGRCSLIGKEKKVAVKVGDVVEVRCLYVTPDRRLYQPTLLRVRTDKHLHECDGSDFRVVNKQVLAQLPAVTA